MVFKQNLREFDKEYQSRPFNNKFREIHKKGYFFFRRFFIHKVWEFDK